MFPPFRVLSADDLRYYLSVIYEVASVAVFAFVRDSLRCFRTGEDQVSRDHVSSAVRTAAYGSLAVQSLTDSLCHDSSAPLFKDPMVGLFTAGTAVHEDSLCIIICASPDPVLFPA